MMCSSDTHAKCVPQPSRSLRASHSRVAAQSTPKKPERLRRGTLIHPRAAHAAVPRTAGPPGLRSRCAAATMLLYLTGLGLPRAVKGTADQLIAPLPSTAACPRLTAMEQLKCLQLPVHSDIFGNRISIGIASMSYCDSCGDKGYESCDKSDCTRGLCFFRSCTRPCTACSVTVTGAGDTRVNGLYVRKKLAEGPPAAFWTADPARDWRDSVKADYTDEERRWYKKDDGCVIFCWGGSHRHKGVWELRASSTNRTFPKWLECYTKSPNKKWIGADTSHGDYAKYGPPPTLQPELPDYTDNTGSAELGQGSAELGLAL